MRVLILGGTVYLSKEVARQAAARGHHVTVAARGKSGGPPDGVEFIGIDRSSAEGVEPLRGKEFDAVIDVARIPAQVGPVLDALADGAAHWTFVSSISVYADHSKVDEALLEPAPDDSDDPDVALYGASKVTCENLVRERLGDKAFVVRPGLVFGPHDPNDRFGYWPLRVADGGEILAPGRPERLVQWIDVRNLAAWILDGAERRLSGTFDAITDAVGMGDFLDGVTESLQELGVEAPARFTWVPQEFLLEHGVNPWAGVESLGLWVPEPDYDGMLNRPAGPAVDAGLRLSTLAETVQAWWAAKSAEPELEASLSPEKEAEVLAAWHLHESERA
ncbi:NAD-dependent epimerase/dehydratase family protein [Glycomyces buryatensis]|uniref:NAD-dependent epimerase/dehydratase family protein n=1 Tax=Glycomyces buryatensis TaxID=2570927 RepID=A0A4S8QG04_9ACTN|nr:NAD-dependent epimerase/dehydratase family protein [Glycomyces buryatensis]